MEVGIEIIDHHLKESITQEKLLTLIHTLNKQDSVNGILVPLPLPNNIH